MERPALLQEREKTHGSFEKTARIAIKLKHIYAEELDGKAIDNRHSESLSMIATKTARLLSGDINNKDTWDDIAGYAQLGAEACPPKKP